MSRIVSRPALLAAAAAAVVSAGCGDFVRQGRGPMLATVATLEAASGAEPTRFGNTVNSDVITLVSRDENGTQVRVPTIFSDLGRATVTVMLKDPGTVAAPSTPTTVNQVTFTRYRVVFRRADGRNAPGVDVPYPFDSSATFTASVETPGVVGFELVRHLAKQEAPLMALTVNNQIIGTIAEVTFYGQDRAGNEVIAAGQIGVTFGNFGDPE